MDEAVLKLKLAEEHEQKFKQELSALAGAVGSGSKQNTQVAAPASGAGGVASAAASGPASNGGVDSQSAAPKQERVTKGRGAPQQKRAKNGWREFLPRSTPAAWAKGVECWFKENAVDRHAFLNINGLTKKNVKLMLRFPINEVILTMSKTLSAPIWWVGKGGMGLGKSTPKDMVDFNNKLQDGFQYLLDNFCDPTDKPDA